MSATREPSSPALSDLPPDVLAAYGRDLGLSVEPDAPHGALLRRVRERQELLLELDREAMLDVVVWARIPVRRSASKEQLAKAIAAVTKVRYDALSDRGLRVLARLHGVDAAPHDSRELIEKRLRHQEGLWSRIKRGRRRAVGTWLSRLVEGPEEGGAYEFLPEDSDAAPSLTESIEQEGVVGGIAHRLRGAADQYVKQKLDEIEARIDRKLDEIDKRLAEWRDQEIRSRLRIVKITLLAAVVVALVSLGYDYLKGRGEMAGPASVSSTTSPEDAGATPPSGP
jgi:hypothetical protein